MCEREGELTCPFLVRTESGHYRCDLPGVEERLSRSYLNEFCLRPHCRKCHYYQAFEKEHFPRFNPKYR